MLELAEEVRGAHQPPIRLPACLPACLPVCLSCYSLPATVVPTGLPANRIDIFLGRQLRLAGWLPYLTTNTQDC